MILVEADLGEGEHCVLGLVEVQAVDRGDRVARPEPLTRGDAPGGDEEQRRPSTRLSPKRGHDSEPSDEPQGGPNVERWVDTAVLKPDRMTRRKPGNTRPECSDAGAPLAVECGDFVSHLVVIRVQPREELNRRDFPP